MIGPVVTPLHTRPLAPLLNAHRAGTPPPIDTPAAAAIRAASTAWLSPACLDSADDSALAAAVSRFQTAIQPIAFHQPWVDRRGRFLRHALNHLMRGQDPLPDRLARCLTPGATYTVPGLGPTFWSAVVKAIDPDRHPWWCPLIESGLLRLGLVRELPTPVGQRFAAVLRGYQAVGAASPCPPAFMADDFLVRVSRMSGRELPAEPAEASAFAWSADATDVEHALREVRVRIPLRKRLRETCEETAKALGVFQAATRAGHTDEAFAAFQAAFPNTGWEHALPALDDAYHPALPPAERAVLWCEVATVLRERFRVHPLELADVVLAVTEQDHDSEPDAGAFGGFSTDTFRFLGELAGATSRDWMAEHRERYEYVLREPLVELCRAVAERYVQPVLNREHGWNLECDARAGRALTSIVKNDFGRSGPYQPVQWVTFYRRAQANKRADAQFFVRLAAGGLMYGFHLGATARAAGKQFRRNVQEHAEAIVRAVAAGGVFEQCRFWAGDDLGTEVPVKSAADLRAWAVHKTLAVGKRLPPDAPLLRRDELAGEVLLTFDRLVPLFACAAEADPRPLLARRAGSPADPPPFDRPAFTRETFLSEPWLDRVLGLLRLKRQLILQGVPGTGKTHVVKCLARLLTHDNSACVRLVQFHPSYTYEEFVEGIRARSVEGNGGTQVTYPVEDGVLCAFAAQAATRPSETHVLVIDEFNRGNLPRIFGELLYLLEYRDQEVTLPYSRRPFRLPDNLLVLATMNTADRSAVALDQALRRRFSFVEMPPDAAVLASWLEQHPPADPDGTFGPRVVRLFEELNRRLARDLGPERQIGHSFFMVPDLSAERLAAVWEHHVRPLLLDYLGGREERLKEFTPERLLADRKRTRVNSPLNPAR